MIEKDYEIDISEEVLENMLGKLEDMDILKNDNVELELRTKRYEESNIYKFYEDRESMEKSIIGKTKKFGNIKLYNKLLGERKQSIVQLINNN